MESDGEARVDAVGQGVDREWYGDGAVGGDCDAGRVANERPAVVGILTAHYLTKKNCL